MYEDPTEQKRRTDVLGAGATVGKIAAFIFAFCAPIVLCISCSPPSSEQAVRQTWDLGAPIAHVMIIDQRKIHSSDDLPGLAQWFCRDRKVNGCTVGIWNDATKAPPAGTTWDAATGPSVFTSVSASPDHYWFRWNCTVYQRQTASECDPNP